MLNATLLVIASLTGTADAVPSAYDHLKDLECFIGVWEGQSVIPKSAANSKSVKEWEEKTLNFRMHVKWAANKSAQIIEVLYEVPGEVSITSSAIRGWDQSTGTFKECSFTTHQGVWSATMKKVGGTWVSEYSGFNLDGDQCTGTRTFTFNGKDTLLTKDTEQTTAGKPTPDTELRLTRVTQPPNSEHIKDLEFVIGSWKAIGDNGSITTWTFNWAQDKNMVENQIIGKGPDGDILYSNKGMLGWDKDGRKITNWAFTKSGNPLRVLWAPQDDGTWKMWLPGKKWGWIATIVDNDTVTLATDDKDVQVFKRTNADQ